MKKHIIKYQHHNGKTILSFEDIGLAIRFGMNAAALNSTKSDGAKHYIILNDEWSKERLDAYISQHLNPDAIDLSIDETSSLAIAFDIAIVNTDFAHLYPHTVKIHNIEPDKNDN